MTAPSPFEIFLAAPPGLESVLADEARALGLPDPRAVPGGVTLLGGWPEVRRANLHLRGAGRVLARLGAFRAPHLAMLDKRARRLPWDELLRPGTEVAVEAVCRGSRIWHAGAAAERIADAARAALGPPQPAAQVRVLARIEDDLCTLSLDTSGAPLHKRGTKRAVGKAPLRETMAALFLRAAGFDGAEAVADPMCGSGTLVLEAAEIAAGLPPGRGRAFAFQRLNAHDPEVWAAERAAALPDPARTPPEPPRFLGRDRDAGAIEGARANAERAGLGAWCGFAQAVVSDFAPPPGVPPGLVMVNPPYGARIGDKGDLRALHAVFGRVLRERFKGWRVGLITADAGLASAAGLPFAPPGPPVPHGPLKVRLFLAGPL